MVGDGCSVCNPQMEIQYLKDRIEELERIIKSCPCPYSGDIKMCHFSELCELCSEAEDRVNCYGLTEDEIE